MMEHNQTIDQEIAVVLLSISKVAKRLAARFASDNTLKGDEKDVEHEQFIPTDARVERTL